MLFLSDEPNKWTQHIKAFNFL